MRLAIVALKNRFYPDFPDFPKRGLPWKALKLRLAGLALENRFVSRLSKNETAVGARASRVSLGGPSRGWAARGHRAAHGAEVSAGTRLGAPLHARLWLRASRGADLLSDTLLGPVSAWRAVIGTGTLGRALFTYIF